MTTPLNTWADRLDVRLRYLSALPRTSAPNYGLLDVSGNVHGTWAAFLYGYPLLPHLFAHKNRMDCLSWQVMFTVHGQHFFMDILCCHTFLPTKTAQRHAVLSWYTYSRAPPSCNWCSVFTAMRIPIIARHNKTRQCCQLALTVSRAWFKNVGRNLGL